MRIRQLFRNLQRTLKRDSPTNTPGLFEGRKTVVETQRPGESTDSAATRNLEEQSGGPSNTELAFSAQSAPTAETTIPLPRDTADDLDWNLIKATDCEQRLRRRIYDPAAEFFEDQGGNLSLEVQLTEDSDSLGPVETSEDGDAVTPRPEVDLNAKPEDAVAGLASEVAAVADQEPAVSDRGLTAHPGSVDASIQAKFDFDAPGDDVESEAQRAFEDSLVLETDLESGAPIDDEGVDDVLEDAGGIFVLGNAEETSDLEWEDFAFDADDFDEAPTQSDLRQVAAEGPVTRRQRAQQHAINVGLEFGWDEDGIALLTEVFDRYWWSQSKVSMRRELQAGMTPDELALALELRALWTEHPEFAMDFSRLFGGAWGEMTGAVYRKLSWPMSLALVRLSDSFDDIVCLEHFLCELFDQWYTHRSLQRRCKSFNLYLFFRLGMGRQELRVWPDWTYEPDESLGLEPDDEHQPGFITCDYRFLDELGLVPDIKMTPRARKCRPYTPESATGSESPEAKAKPRRRPNSGRPKESSKNQSRVVFVGNRIYSTLKETKKRPARNDPNGSHSGLHGSMAARGKTHRELVASLAPEEDFDW